NPIYEDIERTENEKKKREKRSGFSLFLQEEVIDRMLLVLANPLVTARDQAGEYYAWETDKAHEEDIDRLLNTAISLDMGFSLVQADSEAYLYDKQIQKTNLYPTPYTYDMFDRLEEAAEEYDSNSDITYPEELIQSEDWDEIARF